MTFVRSFRDGWCFNSWRWLDRSRASPKNSLREGKGLLLRAGALLRAGEVDGAEGEMEGV